MEMVHLIGAESVKSAGHEMATAAARISQAVSTLDDTLERKFRLLDETISRFEDAINKLCDTLPYIPAPKARP